MYKNSGAKRRNLLFTLTLEQFKSIILLPCFFCGEDTDPRGIDRWDNNIGYEFDNCRPCCKICNWAKGDMDGPTFVEHFQRMAAYTLAVENTDSYAAFEATQQF